MYLDLNNDQRREIINTRQRYDTQRSATARLEGYKGSMVWDESKGHQYLLRSYYDDKARRRQKSLGRRTAETEALKERFEVEKQAAVQSRKRIDEVMDRQAAINRALGIGRLPMTPARILRALDKHGLLGHGLRVVGTNAIYAYEAASGVHIDAEIASTEDIDLLFDSRARLRLVASGEAPVSGLLDVLQKADKTFRHMPRTFSVENDDGYIVDLIKPMTNPPWREGRQSIGGGDDLQSAEIEGLVWLENAPSFEQVVIDNRGYPLRMVAIDPRVFAIHKFWLSNKLNRGALKAGRDRAQAIAVAKLVKREMQHLPFDKQELRMLPKPVFDQALEVFAVEAT